MINKIMNNKFLKWTIKIVKGILTVFLVLLAAVIIVQRVSNNKFSLGGLKLYTVVSESMVPKYNVWDMIFAKTVTPSELKVGDDVVYIGKQGDFKDKIVTHQIINIGQNEDGKYEFITKGLANDTEDPLFSEDQLYGRVIYKSAILSWCSGIMNTTYGFYFIIFVPIVVLIFIEVMEEINYKKKKEKLIKE